MTADDVKISGLDGLPRWKRFLFGFLLALILFVVLEFISSVYLRIFNGYDGDHLYQYQFDPYKNILPTPNFVDTRGVRHNSQGFRRSTDVSRTKPDDTVRIFLMGGSTAYGLGGLWPHIQNDYPVLSNDQTIDYYLEQLLNESNSNLKIEVINAAITSTWTHHELIYLNQSILSYDPDIVLMLDGFNDFFFSNPDHDQFSAYAYSERSTTILGEPTIYSLAYSTGWWAVRKSALANVLARLFRYVGLALGSAPDRTPIDVASRLENLRTVFPNNALSIQRRIGHLLEDEGVDAIFMMQPMLILERERSHMPEIERELFEFNVDSYLPNYEEYAVEAVNYFRDMETNMANEVNGQFIDLTKIFRDFDDQAFTDYAHLTPEANKHVAKTIAPIVEKTINKRATVANSGGIMEDFLRGKDQSH